MNKKIPFVVLLLVTVLFFFKTIFFGKIPFPGDLLIADYAPWKYESYLGYNPGSYPTKDQYFDVIRQIYPWRMLATDELKRGQFPLWNPYNFSGSPLFANSQSAVLYPLNVFFFLFSGPIAWAMTVLLQPLLASCFTYLFARKLKISSVGSVLSSVAYGWSLYMSVFLEYNTFGHVILWLPLALFAIELLTEKLSIGGSLLLVFALVFAGLAGHLQLFGFVVGFVFLYACFKLFRSTSKKKLVVGIFFLISFGMLAIQLIPTFELIRLSARVTQSYQFLLKTLLLQPRQLILFFSPDIFGNPATHNYLVNDTYPGNAIYIGIIPFVFAILSLLDWKKQKDIRFFSIVVGLLMLLLTKSPISALLYHFPIPFFSSGAPNNAIFLMSFGLSILAGFGMDIFLQKKDKKTSLLVSATTGVFIIFSLILFLFQRQIISPKNLIFSLGIFVIFLLLFFVSQILRQKKIAAYLFIALTVLDLLYFFLKFNPFVPASLVFPKSHLFEALQNQNIDQRFWGYGAATVQGNFATQARLFNPDGYDPLYPKTYGEFVMAAQNGRIGQNFDLLTRSDAQLQPGGGMKDFSSDPFLLKVLNSLSVSYIIDRPENGATEKTFPSPQFSQISREDNWILQRNGTALPHVLLIGKYQLYGSGEDFSQQFFSAVFDPKKTILLSSPPSLMPKGDPSAKATITSYTPNTVVIKTLSKTPQLLLLTDTYFPGWVGSVDGVNTAVIQADYTLRAVSVPEGMHTVTFSYKPSSFLLGLNVSIISIVAFGLMLVMFKRKNL